MTIDRFMRDVLAIFWVLAATAPGWAQSDKVVEIASRGQKVRALQITPSNPVGSVILLAGGIGKLDLAPDGKIGWGAGNQLVRTRAAYARAGFVTLVPDIAQDLKTPTGAVNYYRVSQPHAQDVGAFVVHLRAIKPPVVVIGTSRGAISAANAAAKLNGPQRPDGLVMTAPMLVPVDSKTPNAQQAAANDPKRLLLPMLIVGHRKDRCVWTLPGSIDKFNTWHAKGGGKSDVVIMDGPEGSGDPCEARSAHGFAGIDDQVVAAVTGWIRKLPPR